MTQAMAGRQVMMANMPAYMAECQALTTAPTFDEAKARAMLAKRQGVMSENMLTMLKARHQAYQLLRGQFGYRKLLYVKAIF
jgi:Spy/CpxP family protein refolding chaperone